MIDTYRHSFEKGFMKAAFQSAEAAEDAGRFVLRYGDDLTEMVARYQIAKKKQEENSQNNQNPSIPKPVIYA